MIDNDHWGSVRKVRYLEDIESTIDYAIKYKGKSFSKDELTNSIIEKRTERFNLVHTHYNRIVIRTQNSLYNTKFSVTLPDTLVFMREIKVMRIQNNIVEPLELTDKIQSITASRKRAVILYYVLHSKYKTYKEFLRRLIQLEVFKLPPNLKRDNSTTVFINTAGFLTDIASFYATRDLLYELDAINWYSDNEGMTIFPVKSMERGFEEYFQNSVDDLTFSELKENIYTLFLEKLVKVYLDVTNGRFMMTADLIKVRDVFCKENHLGDFQFKELLINLLNNEKLQYRVILSFGTIAKRLTNYDLKIMSLPRLSSNRLALYINIEENTEQWLNGQNTV